MRLPISHRNLAIAALAAMALVLPQAAAQATTPQSNVGPVSSGDDFATQILHNPWDMNSVDDIDYWFSRTKGQLSNVSIADGILTATATGNDPRVWIRTPTTTGANPAPYEGSYKPIQTSSYRYGTARVYVGKASYAQFVWQPRGGGYGTSEFAKVNPGWNIITVDLASNAAGSGGVTWNSISTADGFYFDPTMEKNDTFKVDFIRLSKNPVSIPVTWDASGLNGNAQISVGTSANDSSSITSSANASAGSYTWNTSLSPGSYQVFVQQGGSNVGGSPFTLTVNAAPQVEITAPSYISGNDYATTVVGNPWDMSDSADFASTPNVSGGTFSGGIFSGTSVAQSPEGDPGLNLQVTKTIDTSKFKYATYRMQVDTKSDPTQAPVARWLWWTSRPEDASVIDDIVVYEGFRTVSYDLSKIGLDTTVANQTPWTNSQPNHLRLDPTEYAEATKFQLDYVMLTANDKANSTFNIRYNLSDTDGGTPNIQFFYDNDQSGSNGTPISCITSQSNKNNHTQATSLIYLPLLQTPQPPIVPSGSSCKWTTSNVTVGTYYVYAIVNDGVDSVTVYSDTPVDISH